MTGPRFRTGQVVTVFRSRLRPGVGDAYGELAAELLAAASAHPGFVDFAHFVSDDDEHVSTVTFDSWSSHHAWREDALHRAAQRRGRDEFYAEYSIQVGEVSTAHGWHLDG